MRITGQEEGPRSAEDLEVFKGLHLVGTPGRVQITVSERKLSIEQKTGHCLDIAHEWVMRLNHTHKPLVPNGYAFMGGIFLWFGLRGMVLGTAVQAFTIVVGLSLLIGRFGARRPTLTIETQAQDCHTLTGNDATLMRLCELHNRLSDGMSLEHARIGLDQLHRDVDYPRSQATPLLPSEPVHLESPLSIATLLSNHGEADALPESIAPLEFHGHDQPLDLDFGEPETAGWMFGEPESQPAMGTMSTEHGLIERGRANARHRRTALTHTGPELAETRVTHHPAHPYPSPQPREMERSFSRIFGDEEHIPQQPMVGQLSEAPPTYLPSFMGPDGAHVPQKRPETITPEPVLEDMFGDIYADEGPASLVDVARREETVLEAEIVPEEPPAPPTQTRSQYGIEPRTSSYDNPRFQVRRSRSATASRVQSVVQGLTRSATLAGRLLTGAHPIDQTTPIETESGQELRDRSSRTHQEEIVNSVANLSDQRGGSLPQEELDRLTEHITRRNTLAEQIQQERQAQTETKDLDELAFDELTESDERNRATSGVSGLARIDF